MSIKVLSPPHLSSSKAQTLNLTDACLIVDDQLFGHQGTRYLKILIKWEQICVKKLAKQISLFEAFFQSQHLIYII